MLATIYVYTCDKGTFCRMYTKKYPRTASSQERDGARVIFSSEVNLDSNDSLRGIITKATKAGIPEEKIALFVSGFLK